MLVKLPKGKLVMEDDLKKGDIIQGYIRFTRMNEKGEVTKPGGFIADDEKGRLFGVHDGNKIVPFFSLKEAEKYAEKIK